MAPLRTAPLPGLVPRSKLEFILFAGSTVLYQASRFLFSLAAAAVLLPSQLTSWTLILAFLVYVPSITGGVTNGLGRELPILIARDEQEAASRAVRAGWTAAIVSAGLIQGAFFLAGVLADATPARALIGTLAAGVVVYTTQQAILRSKLQFIWASIQQGLFGVAALIGTAAVLVMKPIEIQSVGAVYAGVIWLAVAGGCLMDRPKYPSRDLVELRRLVSIGLPIMLAGLIFSMIITVDRWMAAALLGATAAAPYALASLVASAMFVLPTVVSQQTYPRMAMAYGAGASRDDLKTMARAQGRMAALLTVPIAVAITIGGTIFVALALPNYAPGVPALVVLACGLVVLSYVTGYGNYLNVVGLQWAYFAAQVVGLLSAVALTAALGTSIGLVGIALGISISYGVYGVALYAVSRRFAVWPRA